MTLILIRHAHRDTSVSSADNGLSPKGKEQALALARFLGSHFKKGNEKPSLLFSSPRLRCRETLTPLAELLNLPIKIEPLLIEQEHGEKDSDWMARIKKFQKNWEGSNGVWVACSHGDWIPLFSERVVGVSYDLRKGALIVFEKDTDQKAEVQLQWEP